MVPTKDMIKIRPPAFIGMRIYFYNSKEEEHYWHTIIELKHKTLSNHHQTIVDNQPLTPESGVNCINDFDSSFLLPGENGCPLDPNPPRKPGDWNEGDKFWCLMDEDRWVKGKIICLKTKGTINTKDLSDINPMITWKWSSQEELSRDCIYMPTQLQMIGVIHSPSKIEEQHKHICPSCGSLGDNLIFKFYCTNSKCNNYKE